MNRDDLELIHKYLNGTLSDSEFEQLQAVLKESPEARRQLRNLSTIDAKLAEYASCETLKFDQDARTSRWSRRLFTSAIKLNLVKASLGGMAFGVLFTSMVYAVVIPRSPVLGNSLTLVWESGFEELKHDWHPSFPTRPNQWGGEPSEIVETEFGISPHSGQRMLRVNPVSPDQLGDDEFQAMPRTCYVLNLDDYPELRGEGNRNILIEAYYNRPRPGPDDRFVLRAAVFEQELEDIDPRWMKDLWGKADCVDHAARGLSRNSFRDGWQTVMLTISAPPGSRYLLISAFAGTLNDHQQTQIYLDDLRVALLDSSKAEAPVHE